ncbi:tetratricopeptide repeat protein [Pseudoalteromonas rhizosphaerae]|uniref:Tetratricopeptide repeat protein n=1 Tax=Pseudoalteromonas rhizosphaerae TaxID=2518973 RepID=A0ABW8L6H3_9GAMM
MKELDEKLSNEINEKFDQSFEFKKRGQIEESFFAMQEAIKLVPSPKSQWSESLIIITYACEHFIAIEKLADARALIDEYLNSDFCISYDDNPSFIKGIILFEMGDFEQAYEWFDKANSISKGRCFVEQPKKYKTFFNEYNQ